MRNEESDEFIQNYVTCSIFHQAIQYVCGSNHKLNSGQRLNLNVNPLPDESFMSLKGINVKGWDFKVTQNMRFLDDALFYPMCQHARGQKAKPQKKLIIKLICEMEWV
jgi:hypothetical protein